MGEVPEETVRELYTALPEEFVAARDAAAAAAKAAGHGPQATAIKRLRRPTVAAWLVNLLAHRAPERITELAELGTELREAQRRLRGDELRALTVRRRELLSRLADEAEQLAVKAQPSLTPARLPRTEVEETLAAALADDDVAAQVRAGTVIKAVSYTGFGTVLPTGDEPGEADEPDEAETAAESAGEGRDHAARNRADKAVPGRRAARSVAGVRPSPGTAVTSAAGARRAPTPPAERRLRAVPAPEPAPADETDTEVRAAAPPRVPAGLRRALDAAQSAEEQARTELDAAREAEQASGAEVVEVRAALAALEERRDRAQQEANRRRAARHAAERALATAVRRTAKAQAAIDAHGG
ncbi:hypothetical protein ACFQY4_30470 [Catellatospora bangladeshensis]|uniref:Uncharacterized protein n=1 Tax=Catellatospora bangladeshensis TaxID=310355 RepID=A0A8J3JW46_9ACTN|nr:hypothetical protein [Catellatospora bangladeshensis]GIF86220.1 hypothetical protein Cba03nite_75690 [Catellatospora bangladeshensis]